VYYLNKKIQYWVGGGGTAEERQRRCSHVGCVEGGCGHWEKSVSITSGLQFLDSVFYCISRNALQLPLSNPLRQTKPVKKFHEEGRIHSAVLFYLERSCVQINPARANMPGRSLRVLSSEKHPSKHSRLEPLTHFHTKSIFRTYKASPSVFLDEKFSSLCRA